MEEQGRFLEMLQEITAIAHAQQDRLTKEEIQKYLGDQELSARQLQAVYHYLGENYIEVEGYQFVPDISMSDSAQEQEKQAADTEEEKQERVGKKEETRREANLRLYQEELRQIVASPEGDRELLLAFLTGDNTKKSTIIEKYLHKVIALARKYEKRNVPMDEVIAEGNVGLMTAMQIIEQNREEYLLSADEPDEKKFFGTLELEVVHAMESYIDETTSAKDWESAVLAKTNLLHEAAKYMTEEMGRVPTVEELSEYTKIARDEIKDIMGLSEDAGRVASPKQ